MKADLYENRWALSIFKTRPSQLRLFFILRRVHWQACAKHP
jgi:hypothetical protein